MINKHDLKKFALRHKTLLSAYRKTFGKIKTGLYFDLQKKALQKKGLSIVRQVTETLDSAGADFFVDGGTLLGIIRDGKLIAHDRDIDFGIHYHKDFTPGDLDRQMKRLSFKRIKIFKYKGKPLEITYTNGITHIDFFWHFEKAGSSILYTFYRNPAYEYPSAKHFTPIELHRSGVTELKKISVDDMTVYVPANYEEYLVSAYTENWRIPDPTWTYRREEGLREIRDDFGIMVN